MMEKMQEEDDDILFENQNLILIIFYHLIHNQQILMDHQYEHLHLKIFQNKFVDYQMQFYNAVHHLNHLQVILNHQELNELILTNIIMILFQHYMLFI